LRSAAEKSATCQNARKPGDKEELDAHQEKRSSGKNFAIHSGDCV